MHELLIPASQVAELRTRFAAIEGQARQWQRENAVLNEAVHELETELHREGFMRLGGSGSESRNFSREALRTIARQSFLFWLKNPLVRRGVDIISDYVWGQGINLKTEDEDVQQVIDGFTGSTHNKKNLFGHIARVERDQDLSVNGNVFFIHFVNPATGAVKLSDLPCDEIEDIISNPQDASEPWFYHRKWQAKRIDQKSGRVIPRQLEALYPDINYRPLEGDRPDALGEVEIRWETPLLHISDGGASGMKFAVPITYPALAWARAYNEYLESWIKLVKSLARLAWNAKTKGGQTAVDALNTKFNTSMTADSANETNPSPVAGAMFIHGDGVELDPIRTNKVAMSLEDGRRILLMVAAAMGLPESFFGDVSVGTLATAKSLDRPTELRMRRRQSLWQDVYETEGRYAMEQSGRAPSGVLRGFGKVEIDEVDRRETWVWSEGLDTTFQAKFPEILERNMESEVKAIATAATANGLPIQGMDLRTYAGLQFAALNIPDPDKKAEELFGKDSQPAPQVTVAQENVIIAIREMKAALESGASLLNGHA